MTASALSLSHGRALVSVQCDGLYSSDLVDSHAFWTPEIHGHMNQRLSDAWRRAAHDGRALGEALIVVVATWLLLGWWFGDPLMRGDGPLLFAPYLRQALEAGPAWSDYAYRFGVIGGSAMEPAVGTSPLVLACSVFGLSTTTVSNLAVLFVQLCFGFFAIVMVEALLTVWSGSQRHLSRFERVITIWCCAFAPVFGWRFAAGHENLLAGLLPWLALIALWWSARARTLSLTSLVVAWFAVFHALPSFGQQTMVFSVVFGAPIMLVTFVGGRRARLFTREHVCVALALAAGGLCAAPLVLEMMRYHLGDDSSRGVARSMFYAYGDPHLRDWVTSIPWTPAAAQHWPGKIATHETNYPLGPLVVFAIALWPRNVVRDIGFAVIIAALLAITFSLDCDPIASLLRQVPMVDAFRVPARAILPVLMLVPVLALAALFYRSEQPLVGQRPWAILGAAVIAITCSHFVPSVVREAIAWLTCGTLCLALRWNPIPWRSSIPWAIALAAALGVAAFEERYDSVQSAKRIEDEPRALHNQVVAQAAELTMPLTRVQVTDRPPPFGKSTAFAAGLPTLDGVGFPPRRFLRLLSALWNEPVSPAEIDFELTHRDRFDILAQLYNVKYVIGPEEGLTRLAPTNGPAWFTREVVMMNDPREMIRVLRMRDNDVRATLSRVAWVLRDEAPATIPTDAACGNARVTNVRTDRLGQTAELEVVVDGTCVLVVATNYASMLHASDTIRELEVFPVDVALTAIVVPRGTTMVKLAPVVRRQWWWALLGYIALAAALTGLGSAVVVANDRNEKTPL